ncbi:MAG: response regulator [Candidatus Bathyarchaeota archaeon]|nr:MAG: response regulator [Candidatus Bathyarchaeota archaeon]
MRNGSGFEGDQRGLTERARSIQDTADWSFRKSAILSRRLSQGRRIDHEEADRLAVLLVDDDTRLCESLAALLRVVGYDVLNAYSGAEALAFVGSRDFDSVIIDIDLPDMEGIRLLKEIKNRDGDIGTLMLSGRATVEDAVESLNHGADAFILKPADPDDLITKLERVTKLKQLERDIRISEARYRGLFESIGDGAFQIDLDGNYTALNKAGAEILGFEDPTEVLGGALKAWETYLSIEEYEALQLKVLREGEVKRVMRRFRRRKGSLGWLEITLKTRKDIHGNVVGLEGIFRDVSDRIRYQEMLEAIYSLWVDLGEVQTVEEVGGLTLEFLRAMLGIDRGAFSVVEGEVIKPVGAQEDEYDELSVKGSSLASRAVRTGEAQLAPDTEKDKEWMSTSVGEGGEVLTELAVPVKMAEGVVGVIDIGRTKPIPFTEEDMKLVEIIAEQVASALERLVRSKIGLRQGSNLRDFL